MYLESHFFERGTYPLPFLRAGDFQDHAPITAGLKHVDDRFEIHLAHIQMIDASDVIAHADLTGASQQTGCHRVHQCAQVARILGSNLHP